MTKRFSQDILLGTMGAPLTYRKIAYLTPVRQCRRSTKVERA